MGRPPCCDNGGAGVKKGPWTPEEDIVLVSYIQQHGPGNWRSVPENTGQFRARAFDQFLQIIHMFLVCLSLIYVLRVLRVTYSCSFLSSLLVKL
jgi:hypothetical protein